MMWTLFIAQALLLLVDGFSSRTRKIQEANMDDSICDRKVRWAKAMTAKVPAEHELALSISGGDVNITHWANRLGNNLAQLEHALLLAARLGKLKVLLPLKLPENKDCPPCSGHINDIMDLPAEIKLDPEPTLIEKTCEDQATNEVNFGPAACNFTITDGAMLLRKYALPLIKKEVKDVMLNKLGDDDLVIHLRSGDTITQQMNANHIQPPCYFYKALINKPPLNGKPYNKIVLVTEKDLMNPCIEVMKNEFQSRLEVQASSLAEDAGTILAARHLIGGRSTFSQELAKMSTRLQHVYMPIAYEWHFKGWETDCMQGVDSYVYHLNGMGRGQGNSFKSYKDMCKWMVNDARDLPDPVAPCQSSHEA